MKTSQFLRAAWAIGWCGLLATAPLGELQADDPPANPPDIVRVVKEPESRTAVAVHVGRLPLVHTAQLLPVDAEGKLTGAGSLDQQLDRLFENATFALRAAGADWSGIVKLNFYVRDTAHAEAVRKSLAQRLAAKAEPAVSFVTTRLPHPDALVALDVIAALSANAAAPSAAPPRVKLLRAPQLHAPHPRAQQLGILPAGGRIDIAGQAEKGDLRVATRETLKSLRRTLELLGQSDADIVQLKSFIKSMSDVAQVEAEFAAFFGERPVPPLVFVEWESSLPIEIELVAAAKPPIAGTPAPVIEYITPPWMTASPVYSRVARAHADRTIYVAGLFARQAGSGAEQVEDIYAQLADISLLTGTDLRHLAKATYYVSNEDASGKLNELRPKYYDPKRPPTASKAMVSGVGQADRTITIDMIAVPAKPSDKK